MTILACQTPGISGEVFNVAFGKAHSVLELLDELNQIMGLSLPLVPSPKTRGCATHPRRSFKSQAAVALAGPRGILRRASAYRRVVPRQYASLARHGRAFRSLDRMT